jgi:hypothetical protein
MIADYIREKSKQKNQTSKEIAKEIILSIRARNQKKPFIEYFLGTIGAKSDRCGFKSFELLQDSLEKNYMQVRELALMSCIFPITK